MKKLTAGIFATILGLTAIDAYAALPAGVSKVATTNYVDGAMGAAVTSAVTSAKSYTDEKVGGIVVPDVSDFATTTYVDTQDAAAIAAAATDATSKANTAEANAKAYTDAEIGEIGEMTVKAYVDNAKDAARYDDTALAGRVTAAETDIDTLEGSVATINTELGKKANSADLAAVATSGSYTDLTNVPTDLVTDADIANMATKTDIADMATNAGVAATYATKAYADQAEADAISTAATDATSKANTAEANAKAYTDAEIGEIGEMTVKAYVDNAKDAARYDDTALAGRVTTAETDIGELEAGHQAQAQQIGVVETDISNIKTEQTTQNNSIKALQDAAGNYVTWDDVENTYPAAN